MVRGRIGKYMGIYVIILLSATLTFTLYNTDIRTGMFGQTVAHIIK